jgi:hypothetical protein
MRVLSRNRCLTFNPETRPLRQHRPADGIFCPSHAWDFRCDEAAKVATRLARGEHVFRDPAASPLGRWWAGLEAGCARSLRKVLLAEIDRTDRSDAVVSVTARILVRTGEIDR